ncbi:MAG: hypothetical protein QME16_00735 [Planctomycetota bacterium]|nr:hypothetical protein [Planctomycetota bacterium]
MNYAEIVFPIPVDKSFLYRIPAGWEKELKSGARVKVSFGNRSRIGYCVSFQEKTSLPRIKEIEEIIDKEPLLSENLLKLCRWMADYYFCSLGQAIECVLPCGVRRVPTIPFLLAVSPSSLGSHHPVRDRINSANLWLHLPKRLPISLPMRGILPIFFIIFCISWNCFSS